MVAVALVPAVLSLLVLTAHFLRAASPLLPVPVGLAAAGAAPREARPL